MNVKLSNCPLCGGKVVLTVVTTPLEGVDIDCEKCQARFTFFESDESKAAIKFNTRPVHPDTKRIDWIADPNSIGLLYLPKKMTKKHPTDLRAAIDESIIIEKAKRL